MTRPAYIKHWTEVQDPDNASYPKSTELLSIGSALGKRLGLTRIGIHHEFLPPGRRTSWPHAESSEEEFGFVIEGHPDVWIDGYLHRLNPGDAVAFPPATGIAHTFINNSDQNVRLIIVGEASKPENKIYYPLHPELKEIRKDWWNDAPMHPLGPHDGLPDRPRMDSSSKNNKE
ncbi:MAG: cupin domain-containing protein [Pseudomonadota bacterium]